MRYFPRRMAGANGVPTAATGLADLWPFECAAAAAKLNPGWNKKKCRGLLTNGISLDIFGYIRGGNAPAPKNEDKQMEIKGNVHLFFEQSGVFKNEFKKMGFCAFDYDIQNNFEETDFIIDLFDEIERAYNGGGSIFDRFSKDDLITRLRTKFYL